MKSKKEILQENIEDIIKLRNEGMYLDDIGKLYGTSGTSVGRALKEIGIITRKELTGKDMQEIVKLYQSGMTIADISKKFHKTGSVISQILKDNDVEVEVGYSNRIYRINKFYFDNIDTQEKAYIIGFLMADGNVSNNKIQISLQEGDKHILENIRDCIGSNAPLYYIDYKEKYKINDGYNRQNQWRLTIANKYIANKLINLGIVENKSLVLKFPNWLSDELLPHLLRGYMDGDGHIDKKRNMVQMVGTYDFLTSVQNKMFEILDIKCRVAVWHKNGITGELTITNLNDTKKFLDYIYKDSTIYLNRKYETYFQKYINNTKVA